MMTSVGCLVNMLPMLVGLLRCSDPKVDINRLVKEKGPLKVLDCE